MIEVAKDPYDGVQKMTSHAMDAILAARAKLEREKPMKDQACNLLEKLGRARQWLDSAISLLFVALERKL